MLVVAAGSGRSFNFPSDASRVWKPSSETGALPSAGRVRMVARVCPRKKGRLMFLCGIKELDLVLRVRPRLDPAPDDCFVAQIGRTKFLFEIGFFRFDYGFLQEQR